MCVFEYGCWIYALKVNFLSVLIAIEEIDTSAGFEIAFKYLLNQGARKSKGFIDFQSGYSHLFLVIAIGAFECKTNAVWKPT